MKIEIMGTLDRHEYRSLPLLRRSNYLMTLMCDEAVRDLLGHIPEEIKVTISDKLERGLMRAEVISYECRYARVSYAVFHKLKSQQGIDYGAREYRGVDNMIYFRLPVLEALEEMNSPAVFYWKVEAVNNK